MLLCLKYLIIIIYNRKYYTKYQNNNSRLIIILYQVRIKFFFSIDIYNFNVFYFYRGTFYQLTIPKV